MVNSAESFLKVSGWSSEFESVDKVLRHYKRRIGSEKTKQNVLSCLKSLCENCGKNPDELVKLNVKGVSKVVQEFVDGLAEKKRSIRYVNVILAYLKTFFKVNGFEGRDRLQVERYFQPARYRKRPEYVPTAEEIERMIFSARSKRNKAVIFLLYTTGLRSSTLRALIIGDMIEELRNNRTIVKVPVYPKMKERIPEACKGGIPYYTFASKRSVQALKEYLGDRKQEYGGLEDEEPLFCSESTNITAEVKRATPIMRKNVQQIVKRAAKIAGIAKWKHVSPHCLRKAYESALRNNRLDPKDQEFLMGHILPGTQDPYYDHTKVEELRKKYAKIAFFPHRGVSVEELRKKQVVDMVKILGFSDDRIKKVEEALAKYEHVDEALEEIKKLSLDSGKLKENPRDDPKMIVDENELEDYLAEGWDVENVLPSGRILVKKGPMN